MKRIIQLLYLPVFWLIFILVWILTISFRFSYIRLLVKILNTNSKRILYLDPFFRENAGTEYRVKKWASILENEGSRVKILHVFSESEFYKHLNKKKGVVSFQLIFFVKRLIHILYSPFFNTVIIRRTILLYNEYGWGNFMEHLLHSLHPNVILDFDDDMQIQNEENIPYTLYGRLLLENRNKFYNNLRLYNRFIAGSEYLKTLVLYHNKRVQLKNILVVPTCVDYEIHPGKQYVSEPETITFGWIGSVSNLPYVDMIIPALNSISEKYPIRLLIISGRNYENPSALFQIENVRWSLETEKEMMVKMDIGLMPLKNSPMEKGKCGFKLIQYMGLGIVSIASGITINKEIIDDRYNGFIVNNDKSWNEVIEEALACRSEWKEIGRRARNKINLKYSFGYYSSDYVSFVTSHISNYSFKEKLSFLIRSSFHYGFGVWGSFLFEKTRDKKKLKPGITAVVSAKNEEVSVLLSLKSLIGFADQIVCIDNGSDDDTLKILNNFKEQYHDSCDITVLSMPGALLGECRDMGLRLTRHQWHLRWDADMVFKTSGEESSSQLRSIVLKTRRPVAFQLPRVNLYGDFYHTSRFYDVVDRGEPFLMRFSNKIIYREDGKFDIVKLPLYYLTKRITKKYIFHCDGIKPNSRLIYRNCYFDWRQKYNAATDENKKNLSDFIKFKKEWEITRYGTNDEMSLIYRHQKEYLMHYKRFDPETYSDFPDIIAEHQATGQSRFIVLYKNGRPYTRSDSKNPNIQNYVPTNEDLLFDPVSFLKDLLPEKELNKIKVESLCVE